MAINTGGSGTGGAGSGGASGTGAASLRGGSANAAPTKTPVQYRDVALSSWNAQTLYAGLT